MDPFGNFGWDFGFGFGWILVGVFAILMIVAIVQLARISFRSERTKAEKQAVLKSMRRAFCSDRISLEEFEKRMEDRQ